MPDIDYKKFAEAVINDPKLCIKLGEAVEEAKHVRRVRQEAERAAWQATRHNFQRSPGSERRICIYCKMTYDAALALKIHVPEDAPCAARKADAA